MKKKEAEPKQPLRCTERGVHLLLQPQTHMQYESLRDNRCTW